jgi:hypothetical protein
MKPVNSRRQANRQRAQSSGGSDEYREVRKLCIEVMRASIRMIQHAQTSIRLMEAELAQIRQQKMETVEMKRGT